MFEAAADWNLWSKSARRIQTGDRAPKAESPYLHPEEVGRLLTSLPEPCRAPVRIAVLTGLRIGDLLALRWVDFIRGAILVWVSSAERRRRAAREPPEPTGARGLETQLARSRQKGSDDFVFTTRKQTSRNLRNLLAGCGAPHARLWGCH